MRRILLSTLTLCLFSLMGNAQQNRAKEPSTFEPRETWPFLYEEFTQGTIRTSAGDLTEGPSFNVTATDNRLLYIKDDKIMLADMNSVYTVKIEDDVYLNVMGQLYKVLSELDRGVVLKQYCLDIDQLNKVKIGYGVSSSTGSAMGLQVSLDGRFDFTNMSVQQSRHNKDSGEIIPMRESYYLYVKNTLIPATQRTVTTWPGVDKKAANDFIKNEKIKWKQTESLEKLIIFLDTQLGK
ncbi:MAG: hypothetical protein IJL91_01490 [Bacteroidales bacterium]|nr:hypothetical protein [Bacteroidales bacterium]